MPGALTRLAHAIRMRDHAVMPKMLQVRNVPDELHAELVRRAREQDQTLSDYVREILEEEVSYPPQEELFAELRTHEPVELDRPVADIIREARREELGDW